MMMSSNATAQQQADLRIIFFNQFPRFSTTNFGKRDWKLMMNTSSPGLAHLQAQDSGSTVCKLMQFPL